MQYILLQGIKLDDFLYQIEKTIESKVNEKLDQFRPKPKLEYLTRAEASKMLRISLPTLNQITKDGILASYRIKQRILYRSDEVEEALVKRNFKTQK